jgi:comEA protein
MEKEKILSLKKAKERKMKGMVKRVGLVLTAVCLFTALMVTSLPVSAANPDDGQKSATTQKAPKEHKAAKKAPEGKININTASEKDLQQLPKVGPAMAKRIVDYRASVKSFKTVEELRNVKGIGPKVFEQLKPYVTL